MNTGRIRVLEWLQKSSEIDRDSWARVVASRVSDPRYGADAGTLWSAEKYVESRERVALCRTLLCLEATGCFT